MSYIVYNIQTTRYLRNHPEVRTDHTNFRTMATAKAALTREVNSGAVKREDFAIAHQDVFCVIEKTETVKNLMSGKDVEQSVNTPYCCSVASESYWSS
jgi:hypothetical protein